MYANGKVIPVETTPGMEQRGIRRVKEGVKSNIHTLIYCKNFCKCHNVSQPNTTIKEIF
jgi:hypothetical protein